MIDSETKHMLGLPVISWFMILCGTPITLVLLMNYLPLANQKIPEFVIYSCLMECVSSGIYAACLIAVVCSRLFRFDLGISWTEISIVRLISSGPIIVLHPLSLLFIDWQSLPALTMTVTWIVTVIDWKLHWHLWVNSSNSFVQNLDQEEPDGGEDWMTRASTQMSPDAKDE